MSERVLVPFVEVMINDDYWADRLAPSPAWSIDHGEVLLRCACGKVTGIGSHTITDDGEVSPSVWDRDGCGWHEWITLDGWAGQP